MTLRKYIIVYFILLNLVVVIAQKANTLTPSSTIGAETPSSTLNPKSANTVESCLNGNECKSANETLKLCNGAIKPPSKYLEEGVRKGSYKPEDRSLAKCACNQPYYDTLSACIECFASVTGAGFDVPPIEEYKNDCKELGTTFTQTIPPPQPKGIPKRLKLGLIGGLVVVVIGLIAIGLLKYYRKKRRIHEQTVFAKRLSTELQDTSHLSTGDSLTAKYPPPQSPSTHYPPPPTSRPYAPPTNYPPPTDYPPPSINISDIPAPQSNTPYYPPPGARGGEYPPPRTPPRGGQGGQADSYYDGNF